MKIASLCLNTGLLWIVALYLEPRVEPKVVKVFYQGASILSRGSFFWLPFSALLYVLTPSYFNYIESNMASVSQYWLRGHDIYTALSAPEQYSILYGPWPTLASSFFQWPAVFVIQASKLMGFLNLIGGLFFFWKLLIPLKLERSQFLLFMGLLSLALLGFDNFSYVNRPDSYLIAYVICSLYLIETLTQANRLWHGLIVGVLLGLSVACKIHGFIYFLPLAAYGYERHQKNFSPFLLVLVVAVGIIVSFLPFLAPHVSLENFRLWLKVCAQHGLVLKLFTDNLTYLGIYFILLLLVHFHRSTFRLTFWVLVISAFLTCIVASLIGAGTHHLTPFIAPVIYFFARRVSTLDPSRTKQILVFLSAFFLALTYDAILSQKSMINYFLRTPDQAKELRELRLLQTKYSDGIVELGYGDTEQKPQSYYKPELLARGGSMLVEVSGLMDSGFSGMTIPPQTLASLDNCSINYFILPRGPSPWAMKSGFGLKLFSDIWLNIFFHRYTQIDASSSYTVWKCKPNTGQR